MDEALAEQQREAYKVPGVDDETDVNPMKKRKAAEMQASLATPAQDPSPMSPHKRSKTGGAPVGLNPNEATGTLLVRLD